MSGNVTPMRLQSLAAAFVATGDWIRVICKAAIPAGLTSNTVEGVLLKQME